MILEPKFPAKPYETNAQLFKLLAHPARLAILDILRDGEHCVCHMETYLRDGWNIFYHVTDQRLFSILDTIQGMSGKPVQAKPRENITCPCPHCTASREKA
jgi:DNA-binding transcriptional ArsR family regulator